MLPAAASRSAVAWVTLPISPPIARSKLAVRSSSRALRAARAAASRSRSACKTAFSRMWRWKTPTARAMLPTSSPRAVPGTPTS